MSGQIRKLDRSAVLKSAVKTVVKKYSEELDQIAKLGGNASQRELDGIINEFTVSMTENEAAAFRRFVEHSIAEMQKNYLLEKEIDEYNLKRELEYLKELEELEKELEELNDCMHKKNDGTMRKIDRSAVRALAEKHSEDLQQVANSGGNVYQRSLDQKDQINEFTESMAGNEALAFLDMYAEELNACTQKKYDETNRILLEQEAKNEAMNHAAGIIGGIVGFVLFVFFLVTMLK